MTIKEARAALKPPLIFGNEAQIKALKFLEGVEACALRIASCSNVASHLATARRSNDDIEAEFLMCTCVDELKTDVQVAALRKLAKDERGKYLR